MRLKEFLSLLTSVTMVFAMNSYSVVFAESDRIEIPEITPESKISDDLREHMVADPTDVYPVVIWFKGISDSEVEAAIEKEIGYNIASVEEDYAPPSVELIDELQQAAASEPNEDLEVLMQKYLALTEASRRAEKEKVDVYRSARLTVVEDMITSNTTTFLKDISVSDDNVLFVSHYVPMSICLLTQDEIVTASNNDNVQELTLYEPMKVEECTIDLGTTTNTMGIDKINNTLSLTGDNVTIGIYDSGTLLTSYYDTYGIDPSHVEILDPPYDQGDHSTYCAGIAAGNNGVAPDAFILSASCDSDYYSFSWDYYDYDVYKIISLDKLVENGADVINISWGSYNQQDCYNNWAKYTDQLIANTGVTIVCATGNVFNNLILNPSSAYNCIAVNGFVDSFNGQQVNALNDYSYNHGNGCYKPDVVGPSLNYGTSTAAPYISGMIALLYQYKPSLRLLPEVTKAILIGSSHEKCAKLLQGGTLVNHTELLTSGLTNYQGAGIPNMYRMISIVSQHSYGNGILNADNSYERYVNFTQPKYSSTRINVSMAYLQTNVPTSNTTGMIDNCNLSVTNNTYTKSSTLSNSSTEMVYIATPTNPSYSMRIYRSSGQSSQIKYGYAWSTDADVYHPSIEMDGMYKLKNYNSGYYLAMNTTDFKAYQTNYENITNGNWIMSLISASNSTYWMKNASSNHNGLGQGNAISYNNYYAVDGSASASTPITLQYDRTTGTYTIKRTINGSNYALGISNNSTATGAYANWRPYNENNKSQKWYLETVNDGPGDVNLDGTINASDVTLLNQHLIGAVTINNNLQRYMDDVNRDGSVDTSDALFLYKIVNGLI